MKYKSHLLITGMVATGVCLTAPLVRAEHEGKEKSNKAGQHEDSTSASGDTRFVHDASAGGMMEVKLGKLAGQKAQSASVKQLAQKIVTDHTKANEELMHLAQAKGISVSTSGEDKHLQMYKHLTNLSGEEFDKAYVKHMVADHEKDIRKFEQQSAKGQDSDVKAFAMKCLPTLREHLAMAKSLEQNPNAALSGAAVQEPAGADNARQVGTEKNAGTTDAATSSADNEKGTKKQ